MSLRIAYLCADPGVPVFGTKGASVHVQEIIRAWQARGGDVRLYCTRLGADRPADLDAVPVTHLPLPSGMDQAGREIAQAEAATALAEAALADGVDVLYERYSLFSRAFITARRAPSGTPVRTILEVNSPLIEEQARHRSLVDEASAWGALREQVAAADRIVAVSAPVADWVSRHSESGDRLRVVANGVNVERIRPRQPAVSDGSGPPAMPVVLFVGTLKPWHGLEVLIEAAALARTSWRLRIVGDGPLRESLHQAAIAAGVQVDFTGAVPPQRIGEELASAAIAVAPYPASDDHYFSPLKVYEYAAAGLPIVASDIGAVPQIVRHGENGLIVPPSDPLALARAIDTLVSNPLYAARLGQLGRVQAVAEHSWTQTLERILDGMETGVETGMAQVTVGAGHG